MSVAVPVIDYIDGATRRIYLKTGVINFYPIEDIYHEYRYMRANDESLRKWEPLLKAEGNVPKGAGAFTPRYVILLLGTKLVPFDEPSQLNQLGDMITDDPDSDPALYDITGLTTAKPVFIKPSEAETIQLNSESIEYSSFNGGITIDTVTGVPGTKFPIGTPRSPSNNMADALVIAQSRGFVKFFLTSDLTLDAAADIDNYIIIGESHVTTNVTIEAAANVENLRIIDCIVNGVLDGNNELKECVIGNLEYMNGHIHKSGLIGAITLGGLADAFFEDCKQIDMDSNPSFDMGGTGQDLILTNYNGFAGITNMTGTSKIGIGMDAGFIVLDSTTVTSGTVVISGNGVLQDENGTSIPTGVWNGGVNIQNDLISKQAIAEQTWRQVYLDVNGSGTGTSFPLGTLLRPVNNLADAILIGNANNINSFQVAGTLTLTQDVSGMEFISWKNGKIDLNGQPCLATRFRELKLYGNMGSLALVYDCRLTSITNMNGNFTDCNFLDSTPIVLAANATVFMNNCRSQVPGQDSPILDYSNGGISLSNRAYSGGISVINSTDAGNTSTYEFIAGKFNFDNSNSAGYFAVRGVVDLTGMDLTAGATASITGTPAGTINPESIADKVWSKVLP